VTSESIGYPRQLTGNVDYKTMANQIAAKVLEEVGQKCPYITVSHVILSYFM